MRMLVEFYYQLPDYQSGWGRRRPIAARPGAPEQALDRRSYLPILARSAPRESIRL
jgi:hypothetical protein